jgi:polyhydroxyalkanoate synthase
MRNNENSTTQADISPNALDLVRTTLRFGEIATKAMSRHCTVPINDGASMDPLGLTQATWDFWQGVVSNPGRVAAEQMEFWQSYGQLWARESCRWLGVSVPPLVEPDSGDNRFRDDAWESIAYFSFVKQRYLLFARSWLQMLRTIESRDPRARRRLEFATQQLIDGLSPSNFIPTNPEVLRVAADTGGKSLLDGFNNLLDDLENGMLDIEMADADAFEVGESLAITPGQVVYRNELIELIQYAPTTKNAARRPLLVIPPWMNKYYVMDLRPENSLLKWVVDHGQTVFVISWVNPDSALAAKDFEHYMLEGVLAAVDAIEAATGETEVNAVGYCLGGILLACAIAYLTQQGEQRITSATYLTTMLDFSDVGDIGVFIDEAVLGDLEQHITEQGYLDGTKVAATFRALRANDLVWSFFVNNFLLGKQPLPLDLLYWNSDPTHMPAAMHTFFMRSMYLENRLREPGGVTLAGVPIDLGQIRSPSYILSTYDDHIAPWRTTYASTQLFAEGCQFVLGSSGHIAGVINPPRRNKYGYWTNGATPPDPEQWLESAHRHDGSWWPHWLEWVGAHSGGDVPARDPEKGGLTPLCAAPGEYVRVRI